MKKTLVLLIIIFSLFACKEDNTNTDSNIADSTEKPVIPNLVKVRNKVFNVPSPIQASYLVKEQNIPYYNDFLNSPDNYAKYLTSFKQSLNIGVYGANLGNLFIYDQLSESAQYLNVIKKLAEQAGILNSLNSNLFERIDDNRNNKDSLIYLISDVYKEIDSYLLENEQEQIGVLIITGGWIESLYLLSKIAQATENQEIINRIGEQKNPLNNIIDLLHPFYNNSSDDIDELTEKLVDLSIIFEGIEDIYTYEAPETDPENKITVINSYTTYNISSENLQEITEKIEELRNWIIE